MIDLNAMASLEAIEEQYEKATESFEKLPMEDKDKLISPSAWNKRMPPAMYCQRHEEVMFAKSEEFLKKGYRFEAVKYGEGEREVYDVIRPHKVTDETPVLVAFHGGYWMAMGRDQMHGPAESIVDEGGIVVCVGYDLAPRLSMTAIMQEACRSLEHMFNVTFKNYKRMYLWGHCAGVLNAVWACLYANITGPAIQAIKGFVLICGVYDLKPLSLTSENLTLHMTQEEVQRMSLVSAENIGQLQKRFKHSDFLLAINQEDSPEFFRQHHFFTNVMMFKDMKVQALVFQEWDHLQAIEMMCHPHSIISTRICELMGLC